MAQKLDDRPGYKYDSDDIDKGISDLEKHANTPDTKSVEKGIADAEKHANSGDGQSSAVSEKESGSLYRPSPSGRRGKNKTSRIKISKRQGYIGGGVAGLLVAGIIAMATIISGPLQIMQFANLLDKFHLTGNDSLTEGRLGQVYRYLRYSDADSVQNRRVGGIARRSSAKIEAEFASKGLNPRWDQGRLIGFDVPPANVPALRNAGLGPDFAAGSIESGSPFIPIDPPDGVRASPRVARARLGNVVDVMGALDVKVGAIGMRNLRAKAGVKFFDNSVRRVAQNINGEIGQRREARRIAYEESRAADVESGGTTGNIDTGQETTNEEGDTTRTTTDQADIDGKASARASIDAATRSATRGIAVVGLACAAYELASAADELRVVNTVQPLMRFGMRVLTVSSQIQFGGGAVDLEELGFLADDMFDATAEAGAQSWRQAAPIQANLGEDITGPSIPNSAHPTQGGTFITQAFAAIPGWIGNGVDDICGVVGSWAGQIVSYAIGFTPAGFVTDVAGDLLIQGLFNEYGDDIVALLAGESVDTSTFAGATFGAAADFGTMLAGNEAMLSLGGRVLSATELLALDQRYAEEEKIEMESKGIFERYFALSNPESLFAQSVTTTASLSSPKRVINNISTAKYAKNLGGTFSSLFVDKTFAQSTYSYDVDQIGFSAEELDDPYYANPFENEERAWSLIDANRDGISEKIENCFGLELNSDNSLTAIPDAVKVIDRDRDSNGCNDTDSDWTTIRFYIVDENVATSFDCYQDNEESCAQAGYADVQGSTAPATTPEAGGPVTISGDLAFPLAVTKAEVGGNIFVNGTTNQAGHPYIAYDLIAAEGTTTVSMTSGVVVRVSSACDGNTAAVTINVPDQGISFWYGHQDPATVLVSEGQTVTAGTPLAQLVNSGVDCMSGADHLHIDANVNIGDDVYRPGCSRQNCTDEARNRFRDIGPQLYELYQELPD